MFLCLQAAQGATTPGAASAARVVLLSDGADNAGRTPLAGSSSRPGRARTGLDNRLRHARRHRHHRRADHCRAGYYIALRALAQDSAGHPYTAQNLVQLRHAFADLTPTATTSTRRTEITAWLTGSPSRWSCWQSPPSWPGPPPCPNPVPLTGRMQEARSLDSDPEPMLT